MKYLIVYIFLLLTFTAASQEALVKEVRNELFYKDFDEVQTREFYYMLSELENQNPTLKAYQAVAEALMAKIQWNPFEKIIHLRKSENFFKQAIDSEPQNLEVRFLRFNTQYYLPAIFVSSQDMKEDKSVIMENLEMMNPEVLDNELIDFIINFMDESKLCLAEELNKLKSKFNKRQG